MTTVINQIAKGHLKLAEAIEKAIVPLTPDEVKAALLSATLHSFWATKQIQIMGVQIAQLAGDVVELQREKATQQ